MSSINIKRFNTVEEMRSATDLAVGDICETLGYYAAGDGGGAKYTVETKADTGTVDNGTTTILFTNESSANLVARFMNEGKPVNVLQFGAQNTYKYFEKRNDIPRNDSTAIQAAIDYTFDKLFETKNGYHIEHISRIIVPEGNYFIFDQISMPPYMQMQLDGDVQFKSYVDYGEEKLYRFNKKVANGVATYFEEITETEEEDDNGNTIVKTKADLICDEEEVFAKNEFRSVDTNNSTNKVYLKTENESKNGYYVYKKGIIKICERFDENGYLLSPYATQQGTAYRYAISPHVNKEVFTGNGSLTILNKTRGESDSYKSKIPCYICGVEIGSTEEFIRKNNTASNSVKLTKGITFDYENLRFSNLKISECYVGILSHAHAFYSNVFSNIEFFQNIIAFQYGIYGENQVFNADSSIIGEKSHNCGEMNHFRDCLFTGNKISVNILLSAFSATFTSCHFDFENCIFRAAYRPNLTMDKCHIEGIGEGLRKKYFPLGEAVIQDDITRFNNREKESHLDEFVGIIYAKPITKFGGDQVAQYSYVDLNITSSRIIDNNYMPWSLFSFYNCGEATTSDGHQRSHLYLSNNTYLYGSDYPLCYYTAEKDGIIHSTFLLSEFPEKNCALNVETSGEDENADEEVRYGEEEYVKNIPVISRDSNEWGSFVYNTKPRGNHRFLSNRTLALKYPYFQNLTNDENGNINGITVGSTYGQYSEISLDSDTLNPFSKYDNQAKSLRIKNVLLNESDYNAIIEDIQTNNNGSSDNKAKFEPSFRLELSDDLIDCQMDDIISAGIVSWEPSFNTHSTKNSSGTFDSTDTATVPKITFVEYDLNGETIGEYMYDVPYLPINKPNELWKYINTSTSVVKHTVKNVNTKKIKLILDFYAAVIIMPDVEGYEPTYNYLYAVLVEKNK